MRTPPVRSPARWRPAAASTRSGWPTVGTAPTACSARSTLGGFRDDPLPRQRPCLFTTRRDFLAFCGRSPGGERPMKVLMVSWEYPPVVVGGLGRHVYQLATALAAGGHEVVVLSRRPSGTDPSTHPSTDEISEGVRVIAAAQDPHEFDFGTDMMAWTLAMGHSMVRAGLALRSREAHAPQP